ncbi:MAG: hypothetical protein H7235_09945, partial [Bdellovibrionaceae bacterium]|nr:hypothetical protein [Pseudobdellovibrionaceae bacterium]
TSEPGCQSFQNDLFKNLNADIFGKYAFGYTRRETDNSVITPSANAQFIYAVEADKNYTDGQLTALNQFRYTGTDIDHKFYLAEGLHATVVPASLYEKALGVLGKAGNSWKGLADDVVLVYQKDCQTPETCKHPAYKYILAEFADCERAGSTCVAEAKSKIVDAFFTNKVNHDELAQKVLKSELHGFTIDFNIRVPKGYDLSQINHKNIFNFLRVNFQDADNHALLSSATWPYQIVLARPSELGSLLLNKVTHFSDQDQLRVTMTGLIIPKNGDHYDYAELEKGAYFNLNVNLPGLKARKLQPLIRPYYSTYVDVVMAPAEGK